MKSKICPKCNVEKSISNFFKRSDRKCGVQSRCKLCKKEERDKYKETNHGRKIINLANKKYYYSKKGKKRSENIRAKVAGTNQRKAASKFQRAYSIGLIKKQPCAICKNEKSEGHHEDYNHPLDVVWLCKKHHQLRHMEIRNDI